MGNRAVITFDQQPTSNSIGIYLHWNGGSESILAFLEAANRLQIRDDNDPPCQLSRFVQLIGNYFGGTISLGVGRLKELDCNNGDNGLFVVSRTGKLSIKQNDGSSFSGFTELDLDPIRHHSYFQPDNEGKNIVDHILDKNPQFTKQS